MDKTIVNGRVMEIMIKIKMNKISKKIWRNIFIMKMKMNIWKIKKKNKELENKKLKLITYQL